MSRIAFVVLCLLFAACPPGARGPAGETGPAGAQGPAGAEGFIADSFFENGLAAWQLPKAEARS
jgi:hypothetical protein